MNSSARGLAALCLAFIASRAFAVTLVTDNRSISASGTKNGVAEYPVFMAPAVPFANFDVTAGVVGSVVTQRSSVSTDTFTLYGVAYSSGSPGVAQNTTATSLFQIGFTATDFTPIYVDAFRNETFYGVSDFLLTGPSGSLFHWSGEATGSGSGLPNVYIYSSLLAPGSYTLTVTDTASVWSDGRFFDYGSDSIRMTVMFGVPDCSSTLGLLAIGLVFLSGFHRRRTLLPRAR